MKRVGAAVFAVFLLLALGAAAGCGRKAKPEPLRSAAVPFITIGSR